MNNILSAINATNNAQNQQHPLAIAERADIHKSCKSLETLLNVLNDYCEAGTAIVALQKKLAKALRDTASLKVTNEIAGNALNASANIFEVLAEVDAKFVKIADKEYDGVSTEVKKWFKRLTKEEKTHDERIANANAKIKQAGLTFEKKSKKKAIDAHEEHSRYIQLISTLGPEITQEKYNHSLQATQKHLVTTYSVAASLSRIADAEWLRTCESVRRFSPTVGPLGEWRSLCEGGWIKEIPADLVNLDEKGQEDRLKLNTIQERVEPDHDDDDNDGGGNGRDGQRPHQPPQPQVYENISPPSYRRSDGEPTTPDPQLQYQSPYQPTRADLLASREATSTSITSTPASHPPPDRSPRQSPTFQRQVPDHTYSAPSLSPPAPSPSSPPGRNIHLHAPAPSNTRSRDGSPNSSDRERLLVDPNTGSVRSLSAFPAPPTHFPLPPPRRPSVQTPATVEESGEEHTYASKGRLSESPLPIELDEYQENENSAREPIQTSRSPDHRLIQGQGLKSTVDRIPPHGPSNDRALNPSVSLHRRAAQRVGGDGNGEEYHPQEFGVLREENATGKSRSLGIDGTSFGLERENRVEFPSASVPGQRRGILERTDTGGTGNENIVTAMKNRYTNASGSRSPPIIDLPKLHTSVSEMATRYQSPPPTSAQLTSAAGNSHGRESDFRGQESPKAFLGAGSRSPPPMTRHISLPPAQEIIEPRRVSTSSITPTPSSMPVTPGERTSGTGGRMEDNPRLRRPEELAEMNIQARERELKEREQDIMMRERELERDRTKLLNLHEGVAPPSPMTTGSDYGGDPTNAQTSQFQLRPRERRISLRLLRPEPQPQQRQDQLLSPTHPNHLLPSSSSPNLRHQSHHSYSSPNNANQDFSASSTSGSGSGGSTYLNRSTGSSATPFSSPEQPHQPEKKGGWMRRLSMPVGHAFSLDSSKRSANNSNTSTASNASTASNLGVRALGAGIVGGKGVRMDEKRNMSSTALGLGQQQEYQAQREQEGGRFGLGLGMGRRSHDATRSATNLNLGMGGRK